MRSEPSHPRTDELATSPAASEPGPARPAASEPAPAQPATSPAASEPAPPPRISAAGRRLLLALARSSVVAAVERRTLPRVDEALLPDELRIPGAAFVTLTEGGELRGCMGRLDPEARACDNVVAAAAMAAVRDPRFRPVAPDDVPSIHVEVSVLSPAVAIASPDEFAPGWHGIVVERRGRHALFLPQVAREQGWGREETLAAVCLKAGLRPDAWRDAGTRLEVFTATVFDEGEGEGEGEGQGAGEGEGQGAGEGEGQGAGEGEGQGAGEGEG